MDACGCSWGGFPERVAGLQTILALLRSKGLAGPAAMPEKTTFKGSVDRRWVTLPDCFQTLRSSFDTLWTRHDTSVLAKETDPVGMAKVSPAFRARTCRSKLEFIHWHCQWLGPVMNWGQGCS